MLERHRSYIELEKAIVDFESAQKEQLMALEEGNLRDIMLYNDRRVKVFNRLKACLDNIGIGSNGSHDPGFLANLQERLECLLDTESSLDKAVTDSRETLIGDLGGLRKGKTVLKGYSITNGRAPDARFTSSRG